MFKLNNRVFAGGRPGIIIFLIILAVWVVAMNLASEWNEHYVYLAKAFMHGEAHFLPEDLHISGVAGGVPFVDLAPCGKYWCWPPGPLPAVLLMPFVALFGIAFHQGYLAVLLSSLNAWLLFQIALGLGHNKRGAGWLSFFYLFCTPYLGVMMLPIAWHFSLTVALTCILLMCREILRGLSPNCHSDPEYVEGEESYSPTNTLKSRCFTPFSMTRLLKNWFGDSPIRTGEGEGSGKVSWWRTGLWLALAVATRSNLILAAIFPLGILARSAGTVRSRLQAAGKLLVPSLVSFCVLGWYNWVRFGSWFENGYRAQLLTGPFEAARRYGLFSLRHVPTNLYYMLLKGPEPVLLSPDSFVLGFPFIKSGLWGFSILLTAPLLLYLFRARLKQAVTLPALLAAGAIFISIITYDSPGFIQFGYRYALDFMPFLYIVLAATLAPALNRLAVTAIVLGAALNFYLFLTFLI